MSNKKDCFIITPIGEEDTPMRRHIDGVIDAIIMPVMSEEYNILVAHRLVDTGSINKQIMELIYKSDLVIANLTTKNPNVMYELAFRHTLGFPTITIAEKGTELPFDISTERTIFYTNDITGSIDAQNDLKKYVKQIDYMKNKTYGPIHDYLDSVELKNIIYNQNKNKSENEVLELIVKRLENMEYSIPNLRKEISGDIDQELQLLYKRLDTIECTMPTIKEEITGDLVDKVIKTAIRETPDLNIAKLNMNIVVLNDKVIQIDKMIDEITKLLLVEISSLKTYIDNNINDASSISARMIKGKLDSMNKIVESLRSKIKILTNGI